MKNLVRILYIDRMLLFLLVLGVLVGFTFIQSDTAVEDTVPEVSVASAPAKHTATIAYPAAGLVEAGESVTLYAKRSGFVERILATEGDVVEAGATVVLAVDPVTKSRLAVQDEAGVLTILKATSATVGADQQETVATIGYDQSVASSTLSNAASIARAEAAKKKLLVTLAQVEAVVPQVLRFVQDNKTLFTSTSMDLYTEVVEAFYKQEPNYLRIGQTSSGEAEALLMQVAEVKNSSSSEMLAVAEAVQVQLGILSELYARSESEFFDKDELASTALELSVYSELRTSLATLSTQVVASIDAASALQSGQNINAVTTTAGVASAQVGKDTATSLRDITAQIENATERLSSAELNVLVEEIGLGVSAAPFASVVTEVYVDQGQYVEAGQPLVRLSGSGSQEIKIKLSGAATSLQVGDVFMVGNKTVGVIDRIVPVLEAGSATAYIAFTEPQTVGSVVRGELMVTVGAGLSTINRDYMAFDISGPYVVTRAGEKIYLKIVHDNGAELVVKGERAINEELVPAFGIRL